MWARADGFFPGFNNVGTSDEGGNLTAGSGGKGLGDACADWDAAIIFASKVPSPTAPPASPSSLELAEAGANSADGGENAPLS